MIGRGCVWFWVGDEGSEICGECAISGNNKGRGEGEKRKSRDELRGEGNAFIAHSP